MQNERKYVLNNIVKFNKSIYDLEEEIKKFTWDWDDKELLLIKKKDILSVLKRFTKNELTSKDIENWANLIECREDLAFDEDNIKEVIYILANPYLEGELTDEFCKKLINRIK